LEEHVISNRKTESEVRISKPSGEERARQLRELLAEIRSQENQWVKAMRERDSLEYSTLGDEGDSAASDEGFELTASLAELAGNRATAVESALRRFQEGRYGLCEECGEEIPVERLKAVPATVLCVDCQRELETASKTALSRSPDLWISAPDSPSIGSESGDGEGSPAAESAASEPKRRRGRPRKQ
jgi:RNA polymerase-binding protein DksA